MPINHCMTFGTFNEQRFFTYPQIDTYQFVIINANMVAHAPDGLSQFLLEKTKRLKYIIDPMTHAFQHDVNLLTNVNRETKDRKIKTSIEKLKELYGEPIRSIGGLRPIKPTDFNDAGLIVDFVKNCLEFQRKQLCSRMLESDTNKKYLLHKEVDLEPYYLVCPYFYIDETNIDLWLDLQTKLIEESLKQKEDSLLLAPLVLGKGVLDDTEIMNRIANIYKNFPVDGYLVWIDEFNEQNASLTELNSFLSLVFQLRNDFTKEVINLHGGYFSVLAAGNLGEGLLTGVAHGPEYGEDRSVIPVGGGIPFAKYYLFDLHLRLRYKSALPMFLDLGWLNSAESFYENVCSCDLCKSIISEDPENFIEFGRTTPKKFKRKSGIITIDYPTAKTKENCLLHYLQNKDKEYTFASSATGNELIKQLDFSINKFEDQFGEKVIAHLLKWKIVFTKKKYLTHP